MRAAPGPLHLLLFGEPLAHHGVDGRLHESRGDAFAGPISFAVIDEAVHVRGDIGAELASGGEEFAQIRIIHFEIKKVSFEVFDDLLSAGRIPVPQFPFNSFEFACQLAPAFSSYCATPFAN